MVWHGMVSSERDPGEIFPPVPASPHSRHVRDLCEVPIEVETGLCREIEVAFGIPFYIIKVYLSFIQYDLHPNAVMRPKRHAKSYTASYTASPHNVDH